MFDSDFICIISSYRDEIRDRFSDGDACACRCACGYYCGSVWEQDVI